MSVHLFARTPRAGPHNHVDLHPPGTSLPADLLRIFRLAEHGRTRGRHFLASTRQVLQPSTGRTGQETIVLHGVDVAGLERSGRLGEVEAGLAALADDLAALVSGGIDWRRNGPAPVATGELATWLDRLGPLPTARVRWRLRVALVVVLLAGAAMGLSFLPRALAPRGSATRSPPVGQDNPSSNRETEDATLNWLAEAWGRTPEETRTLIEEVRGPDLTPVPHEKVLRQLAASWREGSSRRYYLGIDEQQRALLDAFRATPQDAPLAHEILTVRQDLARLVDPVSELLAAARALGSHVEKADSRRVRDRATRDRIDHHALPCVHALARTATDAAQRRLRGYRVAGREQLPVLDALDGAVAVDVTAVLEPVARLLAELRLQPGNAREEVDRLLGGLVSSQPEARTQAADRFALALASEAGLLARLEKAEFWRGMVRRAGQR